MQREFTKIYLRLFSLFAGMFSTTPTHPINASAKSRILSKKLDLWVEV